jgi:formylaminopyrimidine deformylase
MERSMTAPVAEIRPVSDVEASVLAYIAEHEQELIETLVELVRFRTPNPPGGNEGPAQDWIEARLRSIGASVDRWDALPGRPNVLGVIEGQEPGPTVVLNGHIDVCEDRLLEEWSSDPYEPVIDGRDMIGRGATDMKCALASFLFALDALSRNDIRLKGKVIFESVIGEEAGEPGTRSAIEQGYGGDFAIVGESTRGRGLVPSIGVVNCAITIASPYTLHLVARRFTTNAGGGLEGANCVEKMAVRIIPALLDLERRWAVFKTHDLVPPGSCNINVLRIEGGSNTFILPDRCVAYVTVTYLPHERKEDVIAEVERHVAAAAALDDWLSKYPPTIEWNPSAFPIEFNGADFDRESPAIRDLSEAIRVASGQEPEYGGRGGITDAGWFHAAGVPTVVFGPGDVNFAHRVDERVHLDDVMNHCRAVALFLMRHCGLAE